MRALMMVQVITVLGSLALWGCGEDTEDEKAAREAAWVMCVQPGGPFTTDAELREFAAQECQTLGDGVIAITGNRVTTLEPLRGLRKAGLISVDSTFAPTLEPLRGLEILTKEARIGTTTLISFCEVTGWAAELRRKDSRNTFKLVVDSVAPEDHPKAAEACDTFPER